MTKWARYGEGFLSVVKYLLAAFTIVGGLDAMFTPPTVMTGPLGFLYGTRTGLFLFGSLTIACGLILLIGKISRSKKLTGLGLMCCYLCYLFAALVQGIAFNWVLSAWVTNAIFSIICGALWLRWKFKISYINPNHFKKDIRDLK